MIHDNRMAFLSKWQRLVPPDKRGEFIEEYRQVGIVTMMVFRRSQISGNFTDKTGDLYLQGCADSVEATLPASPAIELHEFLDEALAKAKELGEKKEMSPEIYYLRLSVEGMLPIEPVDTLEDSPDCPELAIESTLTLCEQVDGTFTQVERDMGTLLPL